MLKLRYALLIIASFVAANSGCNRNPTQQPNVNSADNGASTGSGPLSVVVVDDESLAAAIDREWSAAGGEPLQVRNIDAAQLTEHRSWDDDVLVYPFAWMGELVDRRIIRPFERKSTQSSLDQSEDSTDDETLLDVGDFFDWTRSAEMHYGKKLYGASMGSPQLVLLYRKDVFELLKLEPPQTWEAYEQTRNHILDQADEVRTLLGIENPDSQLVAEPLGESWAAKLFLARAAGYARHRSQYSCLFSIQNFDPNISREPFVRALNDIRENRRPNDQTPYTIAAELATGKLALGICWPEALRNRPDHAAFDQNQSDLAFGIAPLPGTQESMDPLANEWQKKTDESSIYTPLLSVSGRSASIVRRSKQTDRAYDLIVWLTSPENLSRISPHSADTSIARHSQQSTFAESLPKPFTKIAAEYLKVVQANQSRNLALPILRVPGHDRFMLQLDNTVRTALTSEKSSQELLEALSKEWTETANEVGREKLIEAYGASLGINP